MKRVSAGELEQKYKIRHKLYDFNSKMETALMENIEEKGMSWQQCPNDYLLKKLAEHVKAGNWVNVANYAFMLDDKRRYGK